MTLHLNACVADSHSNNVEYEMVIANLICNSVPVGVVGACYAVIFIKAGNVKRQRRGTVGPAVSHWQAVRLHQERRLQRHLETARMLVVSFLVSVGCDGCYTIFSLLPLHITTAHPMLLRWFFVLFSLQFSLDPVGCGGSRDYTFQTLD